MHGNTKSKFWVILAIACALVLTVAMLFCGCAASTGQMNADQNGGNGSLDTTVVEGNNKLVNGGSTTTSGGVVTAVPDSGYELAYWTRTKSSVASKFATTKTVTPGTGETFAPTFLSTSSFTLVSTAAQLKTAMAGGQNIKLTADIVTTTSTFTPATTYGGVLDGAGHKVTLNYSSSDANIGGLCVTLTGVIKNLVLAGKVTGSGTSASQAVGGFASAINGGLISQCVNEVAVSSKAGVAGGFVAKATNTAARTSTINGCINRGSIIAANAGAVIFTNGTAASPLTNLVDNKNYGAIQTNTIAS